MTFGAGKAEDPLGANRGIEDGRRYMTDSQPDLVGTFECVAIVGAGGDGNERPMEAMTEAVTSQTATGGCHEGFPELRVERIRVFVAQSPRAVLVELRARRLWTGGGDPRRVR